ncbi:hypothetical protein D3260_00020 [Salinisphaera sp. Q1T1-3]|nr:hypothetical protein D3260_00020 [Salinisphaera sp. Q1T1-3]
MDFWKPFLFGEKSISNDEISDLCRDGRDVWIINTYTRVRDALAAVSISADVVPGAICIAHHDDLAQLSNTHECVLVAIRADRERSFGCDFEVVQSPSSIEWERSFFIPHWPQFGLSPRSVDRGNTISRIGFFGLEKNLADEFRTEAFHDALKRMGVELVICHEPSSWTRYNDIDIVLAIRDGSPYYLQSKPASKLYNAWIAGCVAFVGDEPAFHYHGLHRIDFMHIRDSAEMIRTLEELKSNPQVYEQMRHRSLIRAREVSVEATLKKWCEFLEREVRSKYPLEKEIQSANFRRGRLLRRKVGQLRQRARSGLYSHGFDKHGRKTQHKNSTTGRIACLLDRKITSLENFRGRYNNPYDSLKR